MGITAKQVRGYFDAVYDEKYKGLIKEYRISVLPPLYDSGRVSLTMIILLDSKVYNSTGEGFHAIMDMEKSIKGIMRYMGVKTINFVRYLDSDPEDLEKFYTFSDKDVE